MTKLQQRQRWERSAREDEKRRRKELLERGYIDVTTVELTPKTSATEVDLYDGSKRVARALRQADGGWAYTGCPFNLVPAGTAQEVNDERQID